MAYVGTVTLNDADGEALHTNRYGRMPNGDATALCEGVMADVAALLRQRPDLKVQTLVDGAAEMRNLLAPAVNESTLGKAVYELVDLGHLLQKLTPAADVIFGEAGRQVRARWRLRLLNTHGAVWKILTELRDSAKESVIVDGKQPVHEGHHLPGEQRRADRLRRGPGREEGLPIGSGATEATCKNLFEVRLNRCEPAGTM